MHVTNRFDIVANINYFPNDIAVSYEASESAARYLLNYGIGYLICYIRCIVIPQPHHKGCDNVQRLLRIASFLMFINNRLRRFRDVSNFIKKDNLDKLSNIVEEYNELYTSDVKKSLSIINEINPISYDNSIDDVEVRDIILKCNDDSKKKPLSLDEANSLASIIRKKGYLPIYSTYDNEIITARFRVGQHRDTVVTKFDELYSLIANEAYENDSERMRYIHYLAFEIRREMR